MEEGQGIVRPTIVQLLQYYKIMPIDSNATVTIAEATQDFSKIAKLAEEKGHVTVLQNGHPKLLVIDLDTEPQIEMSEDEKFEFVAARILREHRAAFEELAK